MDAKVQDNWIEQLEVTGPIKSLMAFVDELERNYDRRVAAMHRDYEHDVEAILATYRQEKAQFAETLAQLRTQNDNLQTELEALKQAHKTLTLDYNLASETLSTANEKIALLSNELKSEQE